MVFSPYVLCESRQPGQASNTNTDKGNTNTDKGYTNTDMGNTNTDKGNTNTDKGNTNTDKGDYTIIVLSPEMLFRKYLNFLSFCIIY